MGYNRLSPLAAGRGFCPAMQVICNPVIADRFTDAGTGR
jgi:hypothetical protein